MEQTSSSASPFKRSAISSSDSPKALSLLTSHFLLVFSFSQVLKSFSVLSVFVCVSSGSAAVVLRLPPEGAQSRSAAVEPGILRLG